MLSLLRLAIVICLLAQFDLASAQSCSVPSTSPCSKTTSWQATYVCLRGGNTLSNVLACINKDAQDGKVDGLICRPNDTLKLPAGSQWNLYTYYKATNQYCTSIRTLVWETWNAMSVQERKYSPIGGTLKACPISDPDYLECLCDRAVTSAHLGVVAKYFQYPIGVPTCSSFQKKRGEMQDTVYDALPDHKVSYKRDIEKRAAGGFDYSIDAYGRPVYGDGSVGLPLPYTQDYYRQGNRIYYRRCYIDPEDAVLAACWSWLQSDIATAPAISLRGNAQFTRSATDSRALSGSPSSIFISNTPIPTPTASLVYQEVAISSPQSAAASGPTSTSAPSEGHSINPRSVTLMAMLAVLFNGIRI